MANENDQIIHFLKELGIKELSKNEKKALLEFIKERNNLAMAQKELELLYNLNRILIEAYSTVSVSNMMKLYNEIDKELLIELFIAFNQIKAKAYDNRIAISEFRKVAENVLENNKKVNFVINKLVSEEISKIDSIRNVLYFGMLDTQKADKLFANCRKRSKHFLTNCDTENLSLLIEYLKKDFKLSDDELVEISSKCATFFAFSSVGKIKVLENTINDFKEYISKGVNNKEDAVKVSKLLDRSFKDVIVNSSTFLTSNPEAINDTIRFLKGEKLGDINSSIPRNLSEIKGNFSPAQLAKIYNESITSLTTSVDKIANAYYGISSAYKEKYGVELDCNKLINGRNFASLAQLRNEDFLNGGKINDILELLKPFVAAKEMENLLQNNLSFLIADVSEVKLSLKNAILNSRNNDELKINVLGKIKNHFDRNEGYDFSLNSAKTTISVDKAKKVILNDMDETSIVDILSKLETSSNEIDEWKHKWKDEAKELRDLETQINLESIMESLDSLESMIGTNYSSYDDFVEELLEIKKLLEEILLEHANIISNSKLNKSLKELDAKINDKIHLVIEKIDQSIDSVVSLYVENINGINNRLEEFEAQKSKYIDISSKLEEVDKLLLEKNITEESSRAKRDDIEELLKLIDESEKKNKRANSMENKANDMVDKFFDFLCKDTAIKISKIMPQKIDTKIDDHKDANYLFRLFVYVLVKEDLVYDDGFLDEEIEEINPDDLKMDYRAYRVLLNDEQRLVADNIYNAYVQSANDKSEIFDSLVDVLDDREIDVSEIRTIKRAIGALHKLIITYKEEHNEETRLLSSKRILESQKEKIDVDDIDSSMNKLNETILSYNTKIEDLKTKKINKK